MGRKPLESLSQIVAAEGGSFGLHFEIVRVVRRRFWAVGHAHHQHKKNGMVEVGAAR